MLNQCCTRYRIMRNYPHNGTHLRDDGFTLIEVMVALVIFSIGLLGVAGLQTAGLKTTHQSYQRTVAVTAARDMADRMRANMTGVRNNAYSSFTAAPSTDPGCTGSACTPASIALHDAFQWYASLANLLPSADKSSVSCTDVDTGTPALDSGSQCTITVRWNSERSATATGTGCSTVLSDNDLTCMQVKFIP